MQQIYNSEYMCSFFSLVRMVEYADIKPRNMYTDFYLCTYMYISCFVRLCLALCLAHISAISKAVVIFVYDFSLILRLFSVFFVMFFISRQSFSCIGFGCVSCFFISILHSSFYFGSCLSNNRIKINWNPTGIQCLYRTECIRSFLRCIRGDVDAKSQINSHKTLNCPSAE